MYLNQPVIWGRNLPVSEDVVRLVSILEAITVGAIPKLVRILANQNRGQYIY